MKETDNMHINEQHWKVLLIDVDQESIFRTSKVLKGNGYNVFVVDDSEKAMKLCHDLSPQIVVMDVKLPGKDGMEILRTIKEQYSNIEVIVASADADVDSMLKCFRLNAADFIGKPVKHDELLASAERAKKLFIAQKKLQKYTDFVEEKWLDTSEALEKTYIFQKKLIESSIDGIVGCDYDRKIIIFNDSMEQMLDYSKDTVIGKMFLYQLFSSEGWETFQDQLCSDELGGPDKLFLSECTLISRKGRKVPVRLSAQVLFQKNEDIGVVVFFRDLTTIKRLKQQFIDQVKYLHQDKMVSLGKLAASVVHEINNPLAGVLNYIRLMARLLGGKTLSAEEIQKFRKYLDIIGSEVKRSSEIVSNLLAFSRKSNLEFSEVDVNGVLERSIMLSSHKLMLSNIQIQKELHPGLPRVMGDFNQLQQCVLNLVFNAADAMPDGGSITIQSNHNPGSRVVEIKVADTGRGISKENLPRIFDPFFSTKQEGKGLGLGLSVVYGIIDRHRGVISAESEPGQGAVFTIQLPVIEQARRG